MTHARSTHEGGTQGARRGRRGVSSSRGVLDTRRRKWVSRRGSSRTVPGAAAAAVGTVFFSGGGASRGYQAAQFHTCSSQLRHVAGIGNAMGKQATTGSKTEAEQPKATTACVAGQNQTGRRQRSRSCLSCHSCCGRGCCCRDLLLASNSNRLNAQLALGASSLFSFRLQPRLRLGSLTNYYETQEMFAKSSL